MRSEAIEKDRRLNTLNNAPDDVLVALFKAGDRSAFDILYQRYRYRLGGVMRRFVSDAADREDLVQEAFVKALRALPHFRGDSNFYTWLYRIAINTGINFKKRRRKEYTNVEGLDVITDIGPHRLLSAVELEQVTMRAVGRLSPQLCQALILNVVYGLDYARVSEILNCPLGTVRSRISRARRIIAEEVAV